MKNITIIGAGNMGGAFYKALSKTYPVYICDRNTDKLKKLAGAGKYSLDANEALKKADIVIVAVKPQSFEQLCSDLKTDLRKKLVISIMAGISIQKLRVKLKCDNIIRAMPNLAAQVGSSFTGWVASSKVTTSQKKDVKRIFESIGTSAELKKEPDINSVTALSGSGPAYFFFLTEILADKAEKLGFTKEQARTIAETTFIGATKLLEKNSLTAADWRKAVTSKKGTTDAALKHLQKKRFATIFKNAIDKAKKRAEQLNLK